MILIFHFDLKQKKLRKMAQGTKNDRYYWTTTSHFVFDSFASWFSYKSFRLCSKLEQIEANSMMGLETNY